MLLPAVAAAWVPMPNAKQAARRSTRVIDIVLLVAGFPRAEWVRLCVTLLPLFMASLQSKQID